MSSCFPFVRRKQKNNKEIYLVILGLDNAGKTTTTRSIKGVSSDLVAPTIGFDRIEFSVDRFNINLYDLGGGRTIRDIWHTYFAEVHGVIFVVDSSAPDRLEECHAVLSKLLAHPSISGKPVLLLANKQDLDDAMDEAELIEALHLDYLANEHRCPCRLECCCALLRPGKKLDKAIQTGLKWLLAYIDSEQEELDRRIHSDMAHQAREQALEREARRERVRLAREKRERLERERGHLQDADLANGESVRSNGSTDAQKIQELVGSGKESLNGTGFVHCIIGDASRPNDNSTPSKQMTVIDLENKTSPISTQSNEALQMNGSQSFDFTATPEPILVRESNFTPRRRSSPSGQKQKQEQRLTSQSLMSSRELRRQIAIACSIDLEPTFEKTELPKLRESMQIEELDESEEVRQMTGDQTVAKQKESPFEANEDLLDPEMETNTITTTTERRHSNSRNGIDDPNRIFVTQTSVKENFEYDLPSTFEPETTQTSLESVHNVSLSKPNKPKSGLVPPIVDALYSTIKGRPPNRNAIEPINNPSSQGDRPFSFLILSSKDKRPSPITRIFTPSINKLHPKRRYSDSTTNLTSPSRRQREPKS